MRTITLPTDTRVFCSQDWGYNAPGVLLWWADCGDGHWHIAKELKHQGASVETVAQEWHRINAQLGLSHLIAVVGDPSMWAKTGHGSGESIAETLLRYRLPMVKGDNDRKNGWQRCHELLRPAPDGYPWVTIDVTCSYGIRTLPAQLCDPHDADDIDTTGDDHWVDAFRYGAMSRFVTKARSRALVVHKPWTYGWLKQQGLTRHHGVLAR